MNWIVTVRFEHAAPHHKPTKDYRFSDEGQAWMFARSVNRDHGKDTATLARIGGAA